MTEVTIALSKRPGKIEVREASGRCVIDGCKIKGGGLASIQNVTARPDQIERLAFDGKRLVVCGDHLLAILTAVLSLPEDA